MNLSGEISITPPTIRPNIEGARGLIGAVNGVPRWVTACALLAIGALIFLLTGRAATPRYITAAVTRGTVAPAVSATGTVNPVITVQVGSYDSGPIQAIYADFNSAVKKGQLIAKIDPRPFQVKVDQATAALNNARAQLLKDQADVAYKKITYQRQAELLKAEVVSRDAVDSAYSAYKQATAQVALDQSNVKQQQGALAEAQVNLYYTNIISPVDGTVVSRNVDVGQTVASSFQTPTLFLIARDLTQMQVDTNVSESDIGAIREGQPASFTVDAFPNRKFQGLVHQVRQAPITVQNVVTYDVVINVPNPQLLLKPGMTANVTLETAHHDAVLRVPAQALRYTPTGFGSAQSGQREAAVWVDDDSGIRRVPVVTGMSDGDYMEIRSGDLHSGQTVITGEVKMASGQSNAAGPPRFVH